jgi:hypothetical protein
MLTVSEQLAEITAKSKRYLEEKRAYRLERQR